MKNFKEHKKKFLSLILAMSMILPFLIFPQKSKAITVIGTYEKVYWGSTKYFCEIIKDDKGNYMYCLDPYKDIPYGVEYQPGGKVHRRIKNIIKHGFPNNRSNLMSVSVKTPQQYYLSTWMALNLAMGKFKGLTEATARTWGDTYLNALLDIKDAPDVPDLAPSKKTPYSVNWNPATNRMESEEISFVGVDTKFDLEGFIGGAMGELKTIDEGGNILTGNIRTGQKFRIVTSNKNYSGKIQLKPVGHGIAKTPDVEFVTSDNKYQRVIKTFNEVPIPVDIPPAMVVFNKVSPGGAGNLGKYDIEDTTAGVMGANFRITNDGRFTKTPEKIEQDGTVTPATYYEAGEYVLNVTSGADGTCTYQLPDYSDETTWSVTETKAPEGYHRDYETKSLSGTVEFYNQRQKGIITITKVDKENSYINHLSKNNPQGDGELDGAVFEIRAEEDIVIRRGSNSVETVYHAGDLVDTLVINNGQATSQELELGKYRVTEVQLPEGYWYENYVKTPVSVVINNSYTGQNNKINYHNHEFKNSVQKGHFEIRKILEGRVENDKQDDETLKEVAKDIYFAVYLDSKDTKANEGKGYKLPDKYFKKKSLNGKDTPVINPTKNNTEELAKDKQPLYMVVKTDGNGNAGSNQPATIVWVNGAEVTNNNKEYPLPYGKYTIKELNTPEGFVPAVIDLNIEKVSDELINQSNDNKFNHIFFGKAKVIEDKIQKQMIKIVKIDKETGERISKPASYQIFSFDNYKTLEKDKIKATWNGTKWNVLYDGQDAVTNGIGKYISQKTKENPSKFSSIFTTNAEGEIALHDPLFYGKYLLLEIKAPEGYVLTEKPVFFEIKNPENTEQNVNDDRNIEVIDNEGNKVKVPKVINFEIYQENIPQKGLLKIEKRGNVLKGVADYKTLLNMDAKKLTFEEQLLENPATFEIRAGEEIKINGKKKYDKDQLITTIKTDEKGFAKTPEDTATQKNINPLYLGKYYLKELKSPKGYLTEDKIYPFEFTYQGQEILIIPKYKSITNTRQDFRVVIKKALQNGQTANKIYFGLYNKEEITIKEKVQQTPGASDTTPVKPDREETFTDKAPTFITNDEIKSIDKKYKEILIKELETLITETQEQEEKDKLTQLLTDLKQTQKEVYEKAAIKVQKLLKEKDRDKKLKVLQSGKENSVFLYNTIDMLKKSKDQAPNLLVFETLYNKLIESISKLDYAKIEENTAKGEQGLKKLVEDYIAKKELEKQTVGLSQEEKEKIEKLITEATNNKDSLNWIVTNLTTLLNLEEKERVQSPVKEVIPKDTLLEVIKIKNGNGYSKNEYLAGKYYLKELQAPSNVIMSDEIFELDFKNDNSKTKILDVKAKGGAVIVNKTKDLPPPPITPPTPKTPPPKFSIEATKKDLENGNIRLAGATIEIHKITDNGLELVETLISDNTGRLPGLKLKSGKYIYRETKAPLGYVREEKDISFEVLKDGKILQNGKILNHLDIPNGIIYGEVEITKKDIISKKILPGAEIEVYNAKGKLVFKGITDEHGKIKMRLPFGKYTYKETVAPNGYKLAEKFGEFSVTQNGVKIEETFWNEKLPEKPKPKKANPKTGDILKDFPFTFLTAIFLLIVFSVPEKHKKNEYKNQK